MFTGQYFTCNSPFLSSKAWPEALIKYEKNGKNIMFANPGKHLIQYFKSVYIYIF